VVDDNSRINLRQKPYQVANFGEGIEDKEACYCAPIPLVTLWHMGGWMSGTFFNRQRHGN
jgi:hypothetical protein